MVDMDDEILKLNQRITGLLTENVNLAEANQRFKADYDRLKGEIERHRRSAIESCELSDKYKFDLEKEIQIRQAIFEAHQKQKSKFLSLNEDNYLLKERIKMLENDVEFRRPSHPLGLGNRSRFSIMGSFRSPDGNSRASIAHSPSRRSIEPSRKSQEIERLRKKIEVLNKELAEAYDLINGLEFELDSIVYYEQEVKNLRTKIDSLTVANPKRTNPFDSEDECDFDRETIYERLIATENDEKTLKRKELQTKLKEFRKKQEAGSSSTSTSQPTRHANLNVPLNSI